MEKKKNKIIFESEIECPYCGKNIIVKKQKTLITEAVKAEFEEEVIVEKSRQKELVEE